MHYGHYWKIWHVFLFCVLLKSQSLSTFQLWVENLQKNLIKYSGFVGVYQCADYLNAGGEALARCEV